MEINVQQKTSAKRYLIILLSKKAQRFFLYCFVLFSVVGLANLEARLFKILPEVRIRF